MQQLEQVRDAGANEPFEQTEARYQEVLRFRPGDPQARATLAALQTRRPR